MVMTCAALAGQASGLARAAGPARESTAGTTTMCRKYQHMLVWGRSGQVLLVRNDNYGGKLECITNQDGGPNFTVTASPANNKNGAIVAYPYISVGCGWGLCTPGGFVPARVSALRDPRTSWSVRLPRGGFWNATYDIWFHRTLIRSGQPTGGELMIWLNSRGYPKPGRGSKIVWASGARWYLKSWITSHAGQRWRLIQFRRVRPVTKVADLRLDAFIADMERRGWIRPSYWLLSIEAGFEIVRGGVGLATTSFSASPLRPQGEPHAPSPGGSGRP